MVKVKPPAKPGNPRALLWGSTPSEICKFRRRGSLKLSDSFPSAVCHGNNRKHVQGRTWGRLLHRQAPRRSSPWSEEQSPDSPKPASPQTPGQNRRGINILEVWFTEKVVSKQYLTCCTYLRFKKRFSSEQTEDLTEGTGGEFCLDAMREFKKLMSASF